MWHASVMKSCGTIFVLARVKSMRYKQKAVFVTFFLSPRATTTTITTTSFDGAGSQSTKPSEFPIARQKGGVFINTVLSSSLHFAGTVRHSNLRHHVVV